LDIFQRFSFLKNLSMSTKGKDNLIFFFFTKISLDYWDVRKAENDFFFPRMWMIFAPQKKNQFGRETGISLSNLQNWSFSKYSRTLVKFIFQPWKNISFFFWILLGINRHAVWKDQNMEYHFSTRFFVSDEIRGFFIYYRLNQRNILTNRK